MELYLGGAQSHCRTDHAAWYLGDVGAAHAFLVKKHELIKKTLIIFGLFMIWVTSTNYFAIQFTNIAGHLLEWPQPLQLESSQLQSSQLHSRQAYLAQMAIQKK